MLLGKATASPEDATDGLFGPRVIEQNERWLEAMRKGHDQLRPVNIDGVNYYVMIAAPNWVRAIKVMATRDEYKHARHVERWEHRYGRQHPSKQPGEVGSFDGVNWINS